VVFISLREPDTPSTADTPVWRDSIGNSQNPKNERRTNRDRCCSGQDGLNIIEPFELKGTPSGDVHAARTEPALRPLATWLVITSEKGSTYLSRHPLAMKP
jgi:hypothetical protein